MTKIIAKHFNTNEPKEFEIEFPLYRKRLYFSQIMEYDKITEDGKIYCISEDLVERDISIFVEDEYSFIHYDNPTDDDPMFGTGEYTCTEQEWKDALKRVHNLITEFEGRSIIS